MAKRGRPQRGRRAGGGSLPAKDRGKKSVRETLDSQMFQSPQKFRHATIAEARKRALPAAMYRTRNLYEACKGLGVKLQTVTHWMKNDPVFAREMEEVTEAISGQLQKAGLQRAIEGVEKPVYQRGELVGHTREYSDLLHMFYQKALKPHVYREKMEMQHTGPGGGPILIAAATMAAQMDGQQLNDVLAHLLRGARPTPQDVVNAPAHNPPKSLNP